MEKTHIHNAPKVSPDRLGDLYKAMETFRKEGLSNDDLERQLNEIEEDIIKKEILPVVTQTIEPALKQVQRDLILVVNYHPGEPISVSLSREKNIPDLLESKPLVKEPQVESQLVESESVDDGDCATLEQDSQVDSQPVIRQRSYKTLLKVTFPDGSVIQDKRAKITFAETIRKIGLERVRNLGIVCSGVPLVSDSPDIKYGKEQVSVDGFYVMTHSSTSRKKEKLEEISDEFNLHLKVEEVKII